MGFRPKSDGNKGKAELCGKIKPGDMLIAINGQYISKLPFRDVVVCVLPQCRLL